MNPNKLKFLTEKYEKENRHLRFQEEFIALPGSKPISAKFYAKHDVLLPETAKPEFIHLIEKWASATPKDKYDYPPPSSNMEYGWYLEPLIPRTTDGRLTFPIRQCDFIKTEIYIREMQKRVPEEKFTGVAFKL